MQMWERSGGNKGMVDILVCAWNAANPTKPINLSYIVHTEMVAKIAQGVASGDVPDLMGMDLIYAPQFENAGQLVDITDQSKDWSELADVSPGHKTVATFNDRLYGVPLYADVSALFYNKDLFTKAGLDPNKPPTSLAEIRAYADKITALGGGVTGYYLPGNCAGCNIFTVGPLMWASGATIEANKCGDEPLVGDGVKAVDQWARDMVAAKNVPDSARAETGATFAEQFGTGKIGMMGTGNFNIVLARDQMKDHPFTFGISLLPGTEAGKYASFIGGDLVVIPKGSKRVDDSLAFMHYLLERHAAGRAVRQGAQPPDPHRPEAHRQPVLQGRTAHERRGQGVGRRQDAVLADVLRADQRSGRSVAAAAPEGLLHDRRSRQGHRGRQDRDEGDLLQVG